MHGRGLFTWKDGREYNSEYKEDIEEQRGGCSCFKKIIIILNILFRFIFISIIRIDIIKTNSILNINRPNWNFDFWIY